MSVVVKNKRGKAVTLLNPSEKSRKFADELHTGKRFTNNGELKVDASGNPLTLSDTQRAYRSGYLRSRKDGAKVYKYKKAKRKSKK